MKLNIENLNFDEKRIDQVFRLIALVAPVLAFAFYIFTATYYQANYTVLPIVVEQGALQDIEVTVDTTTAPPEADI